MDLNTTLAVNSGEIANNIITALPQVIKDNLLFILNITKAIGIAILVYIIFLIIRAIVQIGSARNLKKISKNVEEINYKIDLLTHKKSIKEKNKK